MNAEATCRCPCTCGHGHDDKGTCSYCNEMRAAKLRKEKAAARVYFKSATGELTVDCACGKRTTHALVALELGKSRVLTCLGCRIELVLRLYAN